jgi:hypothetical protein
VNRAIFALAVLAAACGTASIAANGPSDGGAGGSSVDTGVDGQPSDRPDASEVGAEGTAPADAAGDAGLVAPDVTDDTAAVDGPVEAGVSCDACSTSSLPLTWIVDEATVAALIAQNATVTAHFFDNADTFETNVGTRGYGVSVMHGYQSFAQFQTDVSGGAIAAGVVAVRYDNESWTQTPANEQADPVTFMRGFVTLAHANHLRAVLTPALDLMSNGAAACHAMTGETLDAAYLRCRIPEAAAMAGADVFDIQAQSLQTTTTAWTTLVQNAATQARVANPGLIIVAGLTTDRTGDTAANLYAAATSVVSLSMPTLVTGFWLNSMASSSAGITAAMDFLTQLHAAGF